MCSCFQYISSVCMFFLGITSAYSLLWWLILVTVHCQRGYLRYQNKRETTQSLDFFILMHVWAWIKETTGMVIPLSFNCKGIRRLYIFLNQVLFLNETFLKERFFIVNTTCPNYSNISWKTEIPTPRRDCQRAKGEISLDQLPVNFLDDTGKLYKL